MPELSSLVGSVAEGLDVIAKHKNVYLNCAKSPFGEHGVYICVCVGWGLF